MSPAEQYIRHATRGLGGQTRADAQAELRGAIEDKVYRYTLLGMAPAEAEQAALRDLGSPAAIAGGLGRVHVGTAAMRTALVIGVAGLLGFQAVAQVRTVTSAYLTANLKDVCRLATAAELQVLSPAARADYDRKLAAMGGPEGALLRCEQALPVSVLLKVSDLLGALKGVALTAQTATSSLSLTVLDGTRRDTPKAAYLIFEQGGEQYLNSEFLIPYLRLVTNAPLRLQGLTNPKLLVGDTALQIGSSAAPVHTEDLLAAALIDQRRTQSSLPLAPNTGVIQMFQVLDPAAPRLRVPGQDGQLYAVVQNILRINDGPNETLWVRARQGGTIAFTDEPGVRPRIVNSLAELDAATAKRQKAALVYKLDATDLRHLRLTPVPAAQVRVVQP